MDFLHDEDHEDDELGVVEELREACNRVEKEIKAELTVLGNGDGASVELLSEDESSLLSICKSEIVIRLENKLVLQCLYDISVTFLYIRNLRITHNLATAHEFQYSNKRYIYI